MDSSTILFVLFFVLYVVAMLMTVYIFNCYNKFKEGTRKLMYTSIKSLYGISILCFVVSLCLKV